MEGVNQRQLIADDYTATILSGFLDEAVPEKAHPDQWNLQKLWEDIFDIFGARFDSGPDHANPDAIDASHLSRHDLGETIFEKLQARYNVKEQILGEPNMRYHERVVMLSVLDALWKDHLLAMDHLKEGIGLRGYAQQDPLVAYKKESFEMFEAMMMKFQEDTARHLFRMQILAPDGTPIESLEHLQRLQAASAPPPPPQRPPQQQSFLDAGAPAMFTGQVPGARQTPPQQAAQPTSHQTAPPAELPEIPTRAPQTTIDALEREFERNKQRDLEAARHAGSPSGNGVSAPRRSGATIGRNEPCFCGSGKKYKKCHGANA
jgi:preprotein translocase subunit SecA